MHINYYKALLGISVCLNLALFMVWPGSGKPGLIDTTTYGPTANAEMVAMFKKCQMENVKLLSERGQK